MTEVAGRGLTGMLFGDRYRIFELVGRGAAAVVYRGVDETLGREVALKVFHRESADTEMLARQQAEIRMLASFNHPCLVTLFDAAIDGSDPSAERVCVVMEYVRGLDLRGLLRNGPLSKTETARIGADLASALDYVHNQGVVHRDVKPGNVLLTAENGSLAARGVTAKLTDFGIARVLEGDRITGTGRTVGTAAYLSPEQARGEALTGRSDVYSLGLVLLECLTGDVEFPGSPIESAVVRLQRDPFIPPLLGAGWTSLLGAMTSREPDGRPSAQEVDSVLRSFAEDATEQQSGVFLPNLAALGKEEGEDATSRIPALGPEGSVASEDPAGGSRTTTVTMGRRHGPVRSRRVRLALVLAAALMGGAGIAASGGGSPPSSPVTPVPSPSLEEPLEQHMADLERSLTP